MRSRAAALSIIPTPKGVLGYTMEMPKEDRLLMSKPALEQRLAVMLGGRAAELLVFQEPSSGAANDLERATALAVRSGDRRVPRQGSLRTLSALANGASKVMASRQPLANPTWAIR